MGAKLLFNFLMQKIGSGFVISEDRCTNLFKLKDFRVRFSNILLHF